MTLANLIRKRDTGNIATAIPAISATQPKGEAATVARIATVAVANPTSEKTTPPAKVGAGETATASRWWLIHYPDRDPVEVACCPEATHAEILERYPKAMAAEPFEPIIRQPTTHMTTDEESAIRAWLVHIKETDPAIIAEVLVQCRTDADALACFLKRSEVVPQITDDRITCTLCSNLRGNWCHVIRLCPEKDKPRRCKDYKTGAAFAIR